MKSYIRIFAMAMAIAMVLGMTACGGSTATPETTAAPTTETVSICEAEGHTWVDAACDTPKTCSVCGETEGEALGHTWVDANYQQPKTCSTCAAVEGEPLVAGYVEHGMDARLLDITGEYDFTLHCYHDAEKLTTGKLTVDSYEVFAFDDTHEAMEGYEWKVMVLKARFFDDNAKYNGVGSIRYMSDDYYYAGEASELPETGINTFDLGWNGATYTECISEKVFDYTDWLKDENGEYYQDLFITFTYRIPVGYDGVVVGVSDALMEWPIGTHLYEVIDDTARLFRLD